MYILIFFSINSRFKSLSFSVGQTGGSDKVYRMRTRDVAAYIKLERYLNNYDMIVLNEKGHPIANSSNNPDAANIINEMFKLI